MVNGQFKTRRRELDSIFRSILENDNSYFQPPISIKLKYPCIIYKRSRKNVRFADGEHYISRDAFDVTLITSDPESDLPDILLNSFQYISLESPFVSDNLYHYNYLLYF